MTTKSIPIKQELFRFLTVRGFEPVSQEDKDKGFIHHPDISKSFFVKTDYLKKSEHDSQKKFEQINSISDLRKLNQPLYDLSTKMFKYDYKIDKSVNNEIEPLCTEEEIKVWDCLFYELIHENSKAIRTYSIQLLKANHFIRSVNSALNNYSTSVNKLLIPFDIINLIQLRNEKECNNKAFGVTRMGVLEYRRVEQEVCCYIPGEVSHIENVLAKEFKEKHTRNLLSTEVTEELTTELEIENMTDTSTTTRNELSSEISRVIDEESSSNYGGSLEVSGKAYGMEIKANAYADFSNAHSTSISNTTAKNYAEEITQRAVEKIVQKTKQKRTSRILKEFEENNRHGFDNRNGDKHVTGIYRWVDKIMTNTMFNYGKKLLYEFMLPHPSEFYKMAIHFTPEDEQTELEGGKLTKPKTLEEIELNSPEDITRENYQELGNEYDVQLEAPLEKTKPYTKSTSINTSHKNKKITSEVIDIIIDPDYIATQATVSYRFQYRAWGFAKDATLDITVAGVTRSSGGKRARSKKTASGSVGMSFNVSNKVSAYFVYQNTFSYSATITVTSYLKQEAFEKWQNDTYQLIKQGYEQKLAEYQREQKQLKQAAEEAKAENEAPKNPYENRIIEQRELKRICIEMMMKPFCKKLGRDFNYDKDACEYPIPQVKQDRDYAEYIRHVKFFEQAFDWDIMSYVFHPYYWADECQWAELLQEESPDRLFQAFLQSGIAKVVVPVKCEMSLAVVYYMETGDIESASELVPEDLEDLYPSIADELKDCHEGNSY